MRSVLGLTPARNSAKTAQPARLHEGLGDVYHTKVQWDRAANARVCAPRDCAGIVPSALPILDGRTRVKKARTQTSHRCASRFGVDCAHDGRAELVNHRWCDTRAARGRRHGLGLAVCRSSRRSGSIARALALVLESDGWERRKRACGVRRRVSVVPVSSEPDTR